MRFMILLKANRAPASGAFPDETILTAMGKYSEELVRAGVMLAEGGLHPSAAGSRVRFASGKRTVTEGPFGEAEDRLAGFWIVQVKSKEEAVEWVKRCPLEGEAEIEIRKLFDAEDFAPAEASGELRNA